jgi:hypothetical protein
MCSGRAIASPGLAPASGSTSIATFGSANGRNISITTAVAIGIVNTFVASFRYAY